MSEDVSVFLGAVVIATETPMPDMEVRARETLRSINPNLAVVKFETFSKQIADRTNEDRMIQRLTMMFGALSLLLAGDWFVWRDGVHRGAAHQRDRASHRAGCAGPRKWWAW